MTAAAPLTDAERSELRTRSEQRIETIAPKMDDVFAFRYRADPPMMVNSALYFSFGSDPDTIPDDYYTSPATSLSFQERLNLDQLRQLDDDYMPYVNPWLGTVVTASALGCKVEFLPKMDPAVDPMQVPLVDPAAIDRMRVADPEQDGLMPQVIAYLRHFREHAVLPIGITDFQGPLTTANQLMGYDKLMYLMYDDPAATHRLFQVVTESLIRWATVQKELIGEPRDWCPAAYQVYTGSHAGIWMSDDDATLLPPDLYGEFVVPYNERIFETFGGGVLHYCGNATHQAENFLRMRSLRAIANYSMYNLKALSGLYAAIKGRIPLYLLDFTPVDYARYFEDIKAAVDVHRGVALVSQYSSVLALLPSGRYEEVRRPMAERHAVLAAMKSKLAAEAG